MPADAKEFIDFWIENSVHAKPFHNEGGGSQNALVLAARMVAAAQEQGLSKDDILREIGDPEAYLQQKLKAVNSAETKRQK